MSLEYGHFPSDAFFENRDDGTKGLFEEGCYLKTEGTPDIHLTGLFDEDSDAFGETYDLATGESYGGSRAVVEDTMTIDGLHVLSESPNETILDAADIWLANNS